MIKLVAALGNPGIEYAFTRHNIAWLVMDHLSFENQLQWQIKFNGQVSTYFTGDQKFIFIKPETYMNRSGVSVKEAAAFYQIPVEEILVIHDDLELNFGVIGFKEGGGLGGHNGLRSIAGHMQSPEFKRFRLGISRPDHHDITAHVLSPFSSEEKENLDTLLDQAALLLEECLSQNDFHYLIQQYRKKNLLLKSPL